MATEIGSDFLFRIKKIKNEKGGLLGALRHNKRQLPPASNINQSKTHLNYCLLGNRDAEDVFINAQKSMISAGIDSLRKNAVVAVEIIFSLPISWHGKDLTSFFADCYEWVCKNLAGEKLTFDIHLDESAPHAHALILPIIDGSMRGSDMVGGPGNLKRLSNLFYSEVGIHYGLGKVSSKRLTIFERSELEQSVLKRLKDDSVKQSAIWPLVRDSLRKNPQPYADLLSISLTKTTAKKSFFDYKRFRGHGSFVK
jgi:hypothetical protein